MTEYKKQHYIPRFYLKYFSNGLEKSHIGLYHLESKKLVRNADLKNQAYEDFFYGKDGNIETGLGIIEKDSAAVLNQIIESNDLPQVFSPSYWSIWVFSMLQVFRTKGTARETNELINKLYKTAYKHDKTVKDQLDKMEFGHENPAAFNVKMGIENFRVAKDLACKLIINKTDLSFLTSDNPVILYNQFLEKRRFPGGKTGLAMKGLQIFYPISPIHMLLFYDKRVYKIGLKKKRTITTINREDIKSLNLLQALNCEEVIYFNNTLNEHYINTLSDTSKRLRKKDRTELEELPEQKRPDGTTSHIIHTFKHDYDIKLQLSFIKESDYAKSYKLTGFAVELRDENLRNLRLS